jgi:hypothetical protein
MIDYPTLFSIVSEVFLQGDSTDVLGLKTQLILLEGKVETLNQANDKLISVAWAVIGVVTGLFAVVMGINSWSNHRNNAARVEEIRNELKNDFDRILNHEIPTEVRNLVKHDVAEGLSSLVMKQDKIGVKLNELHVELIKKELDGEMYSYGHTEFGKLISLLRHSIAVYCEGRFAGGQFELDSALDRVISYLGVNNLSASDKIELAKVLQGIDKNFALKIEEIRRRIEK